MDSRQAVRAGLDGPAQLSAFPAVYGASPWGLLRRCLVQLPALELASSGTIKFLLLGLCVIQTNRVSCTYIYAQEERELKNEV